MTVEKTSYKKKMKNYLNKSTFKGIKSELAEKYGIGKSDEIWKYADSEKVLLTD